MKATDYAEMWEKLKKHIYEWKENIDFNDDYMLNGNTSKSELEYSILKKILITMDRIEKNDDISYAQLDKNLYYKEGKLYVKTEEGEFKPYEY